MHTIHVIRGTKGALIKEQKNGLLKLFSLVLVSSATKISDIKNKKYSSKVDTLNIFN